MAKIVVEKVRLWSPISQALDVYIRSAYGGKGSHYEQLWRLVQLHEAIIGVLTVLSIARLLHIASSLSPEHQAIARDLLLPRSNGADVAEIEMKIVPLNGGTEEKIVFLQKIDDGFGDPFLQSVSAYLRHQVKEPAIKTAVAEIGNLKIMQEDDIQRLSLFRGIMFVRNKVAHVPLPSDVARELLKALRTDVASLLQDVPGEVDQINHKSIPDVLKGALQHGRAVQTGLQHESVESGTMGPCAHWKNEKWPANPFILIGDQLKVWVLARADAFELVEPGHDHEASGTNVASVWTYRAQGEYHRYAAEYRSVDIKSCYIKNSLAILLDPVQEPGAKEPSSRGAGKISKPPAREKPLALRDLRMQAYMYMQERNNEYADELFDELFQRVEEEQEPWEYNDSTRLSHGLVNLFMGRDPHVDRTAKAHYLAKAIKLLGEASAHKDPSVKARALYEQSKAYYHLGDMKMALQAANAALHSASDQQYQTWKSYLQERT